MTLFSVDEEPESDGMASAQHPDIRAALMLRTIGSIPLEPTTEDALTAMAAQMNISRIDLIRMALREWVGARLTGNA